MTGFYEETINCKHTRFTLNEADGVKFNVIEITGKEHRVKEFQVQVKINPLSIFDNVRLPIPDGITHINFDNDESI